MAKFTVTAVAPNGRKRERKTEIAYTHATVRGGEVVGFHIDLGTAQRAAARRAGTTIVETVLDAKGQAVLDAERTAEANRKLAVKGLEVGGPAEARVGPAGKKRTAVVTVLSAQPHTDPWGMTQVTVREANGVEHTVDMLAVQRLDGGR